MKKIFFLIIFLFAQLTFARRVTLEVSDSFSRHLSLHVNFDGSITASNLYLSADGSYFPIFYSQSTTCR